MKNFLERHLEDPVRFERLKRRFHVGLVIVALSEVVVLLLLWGLHGSGRSDLVETLHVGEPHTVFEEYVPAWGSLYGLLSCGVIILVSKWLGKKWLMRREDYYDS